MASLQLRCALLDLYGPGVAAAGSMPFGPAPWLPASLAIRDALSGGLLPLAGDVPLVCAAAVATPAALDLLEEAGLPRPSSLHTFREPAGFAPLLRRLAGSGLRLALQHIHPDLGLPAEAFAVPLGLSGQLMDKGRLETLFEPSHLLPRRHLEALPRDPAALLQEGPAVLKVATLEPHGGGMGVRPVRTPEEAATACRDLAAGPRWVLEAWSPFVRSVCVHTAARAEGDAVFLGAAEQVLDGEFVHEGNWADAASGVPAAVAEAALEATRRAAARGYRGYAGFDAGFRADGGWAFLDANLRLNASTSLACLQAALGGAEGATLRLMRWTGARLQPLLDTARRHLRDGAFLPLYAYDPEAGVHGGPALLRGIVRGASRREVEARMAAMAREVAEA